MALLVKDAIAHVEAELGMTGTMTPAWAGVHVLNRAGEWFCAARRWRWLLGGQTRISLVAGQDFALLPGDVGRVDSIRGTGLLRGIVLTTPETVAALRESNVATTRTVYTAAQTWHNPGQQVASLSIDSAGSGYTAGSLTFTNTGTGGVGASGTFTVNGSGGIATVTLTKGGTGYASAPTIALTGGTGGVVTATLGKARAPVPALDLYPAPTSAESDYLAVYYRRRWPQIDGDDATDSTGGEVPIPQFCVGAFLEALVAFARGYEEGDNAGVSQRLAVVEAGPVFQAAVRQDAAYQRDRGPLRGGAIQSMPRSVSNLIKGTILGPG